MPFYGKKVLVDTFVHGRFVADIYRAKRGATHCDLDHEPTEIVCIGCGEPIKAANVYLIAVMGFEVPGFECGSAEQAADVARGFIDHMTETLESSFSKEQRPPADGGKEKKQGEEDDPAEDPKNPDGGSCADQKKYIVPSACVEALIKKLGWDKRAETYLNRRRPDEKK